EIAERHRPGTYQLTVLAPGGGDVSSSSGVKLAADTLRDLAVDTVVVAGGEITRSPPATREVVDWLKRSSARRITSVCSGAFLLAAAGLLEHRRATTHWAALDQLRQLHPTIKLDGERIFVRDGPIWTSAGISAGIDLALALIE